MPTFQFEDADGNVETYEISQEFLDAFKEGGWQGVHRLVDDLHKESKKIHGRIHDFNRKMNEILVDDLCDRAAKMFGDQLADQMKQWLWQRVKDQKTVQRWAERMGAIEP